MSLTIQRLDARLSVEQPGRTARREREHEERETEEGRALIEERLDRERRVEQRDPHRLGGR